MIDFIRMNPKKFHNSKVDEDPQELIDEVYKVLGVIGVSSKEKSELLTHQLKGIS